jgi:gas vesicle protein
MTTKSKVILGLAGAAAAGVLVGLLLAPEKGTDTRKKITRTAGDWATQLSDLFATAKDEIANLKNKGSKAASDAASRYTNTTESFS